MLYVVGAVRGVTQLGNNVYVVRQRSSIIETFSVDTLSPLGEDIHVTGLRNPNDIVVCSDGELYVADFIYTMNYYCIWRVSPDGSKYIKWLPQSSSDRFLFSTLSVTSRGLLLTSPPLHCPPCLREYSTTDRQLLRHVMLPEYVNALLHGVETSRHTFVIGYLVTSDDEDDQYAVSELFSCHRINDIHRHFNYVAFSLNIYFFILKLS